MRYLPAALAVLLLCSAAPGAPEKGKEARGSRMPLKAPPYAPYRVGGAWRDVAGPVSFGDAEFATQIDGNKLLLAPAPGGKPTRKVKSGTPVKMSWKDGKKTRTCKVCFVKKADKPWRYYMAEVVLFKLARARVALVDTNANGVFGEFDVDGVILGATMHAIPLRREMMIGLQDMKFLEIAQDGSSLRAEQTLQKGPRAQLLALQYLNYLRRMHGLSPVALDEELSRGCTEHAEYLTKNAWNGTTDPHTQDPGLPGATPEGAKAASISIVYKMPPIASMRGYYITYYHRLGFMHPRLARVGINATIPTMTVIDVYRGRLKGKDGAKLHDRPWFVPADGAVGVPAGSGSELPREPVPNLATRGFPLMVWFPEDGGPVTEFKGTLATGTGWRRPVAVLVVKPDPKGIAGIIPAKRLDARTWYQATFTWKRGEKAHSKVIRFRT